MDITVSRLGAQCVSSMLVTCGQALQQFGLELYEDGDFAFVHLQVLEGRYT